MSQQRTKPQRQTMQSSVEWATSRNQKLPVLQKRLEISPKLISRNLCQSLNTIDKSALNQTSGLFGYRPPLRDTAGSALDPLGVKFESLQLRQ